MNGTITAPLRKTQMWHEKKRFRKLLQKTCETHDTWLIASSTVADWDSMGRVITQSRGRAFIFLLNPQKLDRVF